MSAAPKPRCGKPMRSRKICWRPAGHTGTHASEESWRRHLRARSTRCRDVDAPPVVHGYGGYTGGCRCGECTAAKAAYMAEQRAGAARAARSGVAVAGVTHGTRHAYKDNGCRCIKCVEYIRAYWRQESTARRRAAA